MDYEVLHRPSYALARVRMSAREQIQAEAGAMVSMSDTISMETTTRGEFSVASGVQSWAARVSS